MSEQDTNEIQQAVAEGGTYEVICKRLSQQGTALQNKINRLNASRAKEFGQTELKIIGRVRVRSENNCVPRDIVRVGTKMMLFGYHVFLGLKTETAVEDVFSLYKMTESSKGFEISPYQNSDNFLLDTHFVSDFQELYQYYKTTRLLCFHVHHEKLLAVFQIGQKLDDIRVFRWQINGDKVDYIDNRGERDLPKIPKHDFEWTLSQREDHVDGAHPHINILDAVFVETIKGDLTIKVENNTDDGLGIYREPVEDPYQSLADAEVYYAKLGTLILLKIRPYREQDYRYLIFNTRTHQVNRIDAIGLSCVQLPDDHGLIFPNGYYLQDGEYKVFDNAPAGLRFLDSIRSPNGEDVFYLFYEDEVGISALFSYNLIDKQLQNPIYAHGVCLFNDGKMVAFKAKDEEPKRIHPMQVWETPYFGEEFAQSQPANQSFFGKIGNAELVRGISDCYSLVKAISSPHVSLAHYEDLIHSGQRLFDAYHWLGAEDVEKIENDVRKICATAELVLDEFEKVESIRGQANQALSQAETEQQRIFNNLFTDSWTKPQEFVEALDAMRRQQGRLSTIKELRYIDQTQIESLQTNLIAELDKLGQATVNFLSGETALNSFNETIESCLTQLEKTESTVEIEPLLNELLEMSKGLDVLNETLAGLKVKDTNVRTAILESLSSVYAKLNQAKASIRHKSKSFRSGEAVAEFAAQFKLFSQSINSALETVITPQQCDEQLSRLLTQLEELENHFSDFDEFLNDIIQQREQLFDSFKSRKQALLDERQRRVQNINDAVNRILDSIQRRSTTFSEQDALNTYLASDTMVLKLQQLIEQLQELEASVQADDASSRLKSIKDQAIRSLRDQADIYEDGGTVIKFGKHRFSVNTQALDLTLINRQDSLVWHLIGTDFFEAIENKVLNELQDYWEQALISETPQVYRAEYLAASLLYDSEQGLNDLSLKQLQQANAQKGGLLELVKKYATPRYQEGYEKGIHDVDACEILKPLLALRDKVGLLRYTPDNRALAMLLWCFGDLSETEKQTLKQQASSALLLQQSLACNQAMQALIKPLAEKMLEFEYLLPHADENAAADYLLREVAAGDSFVSSQQAELLERQLSDYLLKINHRSDYETAMNNANGELKSLWQLTSAWLQGLLIEQKQEDLSRFIPEAVMLILGGDKLQRSSNSVSQQIKIENLMGEHSRIKERTLNLSFDDFLQRLKHHREVVYPNYQRYQSLRQDLISEQRDKLHLDAYKAKPLTSFVRNKLINEVYLPIVGDNLAKQMGTIGKNKRTDLMGLLLLISPPGYGKTTLMEYIADRLGLVFMKINCPSLGHDVHSLDPNQAPNATAAQELEKLNFGLEMGNNVMLYLDDIQHTHAEFLQKFISLCDGSRRIEGIWEGKSKTYDMRGKKFCVVMAGNPYTESGDVFKIPDMLANRADIYNLGDVLSGNDKVFAASYIENALTSNAVLQPLATRSMEDLYRFLRMAEGEAMADNEFEHPYSGSEINEIIAILQKMLKIRDVVLKVNQQYIQSAAQDDRYRTEPPFKLQGSYRNMNKMAEKLTAILNDEELEALITDHYTGEAQTLTLGAEENLLKLKEIRGVLSPEESQRWADIKQEYTRLSRMGDENDPTQKVVNQLSYIAAQLSNIDNQLQSPSPLVELNEHFVELKKLISETKMNVKVFNEPPSVEGIDQAILKMAEVFELSFMPMFSAMTHKLKVEQDTWERVLEMSKTLELLKIKMK